MRADEIDHEMDIVGDLPPESSASQVTSLLGGSSLGDRSRVSISDHDFSLSRPSTSTVATQDQPITFDFVAQTKQDLMAKSSHIEENIRVNLLKLRFQREEAEREAMEERERELQSRWAASERETFLKRQETMLQERKARKETKVVLNEACSLLKHVQLQVSHHYQGHNKMKQVAEILHWKRLRCEEVSRNLEEKESRERDDLVMSHQREAKSLEMWDKLDTMYMSKAEQENFQGTTKLKAKQLKEKQMQEMEHQRELALLKSRFSMLHVDAELSFSERYEELMARQLVWTNDLLRKHKEQKKALKNKLLLSREEVRQKSRTALNIAKAEHIQKQQAKQAHALKLQKNAQKVARREAFKDEMEERRRDFCATMQGKSVSQMGGEQLSSKDGSSSKASSSVRKQSSAGSKGEDLEGGVNRFSMEEMILEAEQGMEFESELQLKKDLEVHQADSEKQIEELLEKQKVEVQALEQENEVQCSELKKDWGKEEARMKHVHEQEMLEVRKFQALQKLEVATQHEKEEEELLHSQRVQSSVRRHDLEKENVSSQAKSEFLSFVCHELRNPLSGVLAIADLLLEKPSLPKHIKENVSIVLKQSKQMVHIVNDVLDYAKIEANQLKMDPVNFNLPLLLTEIVKEVETKAKEKGLTFKHEFDYSIPQMITADPLRIKQVLSNLLSNALKYTQKGSITMTAVREGTLDDSRYLVGFNVTDTGVGIPEADLPHIFSAFSASNPSSTRRFGGSGLGLGISKALVERLGGSLTAKSVEAEGSTFHFAIQVGTPGSSSKSPVASNSLIGSDSQAARTPAISQLQQQEFKYNPGSDDSGEDPQSNLESLEDVPHHLAIPANLKVLVVEDSATLLRLWAKLVRNLGCEVDTASNGQDALTKCEELNCFDVILMDISMPKMAGDLAAQELRKKGWTGIIVALTGNQNEEDHESYISMGFNQVICKPFQIETLREVMVTELSKNKHRREKLSNVKKGK